MRRRDKQPPRTKKYYRSTKSGAGMTKAGVARYRRENPGSKQIEKTKSRRVRHKVAPSHSFQFCEACEHGQCAWRPEALRTTIVKKSTKAKKGGNNRRRG